MAAFFLRSATYGLANDSRCSKGLSSARLASISCRVRCLTELARLSRERAHTRTTFRPVCSILSVSWSTATFEGAHTRTWPIPLRRVMW